jgi:hypothetical protein
MYMMMNGSNSSSPNSSISRNNNNDKQKRQNMKMWIFFVIFVTFIISLVLYVFRPSATGHRLNIHGVSKKLRTGSTTQPTTLVMVPGHGMFDHGKWKLAPWLHRFIPDIEQQITFALTEYNRKDVLVMFSGGQTSKDLPPKSEALSYFDAAKFLNLDPDSKNVALEEYARDSFENVLFSLCRFREITGAYPEKFIVIGFEFKRERFEEEHRKAVRFPREKFEYIGFPKPTESIAEQLQLEKSGTIPQFRNDPYGCEPPLSTKREERNFFQRKHSYEQACPGMAGLFRACSKHLYQGPLPW